MTKIATNDIDLESTYLEKIKKESKAYQELLCRVNSGEEFIKNINSIFDIIHSKQLLVQIKNCFREYTDHSIKHVYSVLLTMEQLVFDVKKLTNLELVAIILSALLSSCYG